MSAIRKCPHCKHPLQPFTAKARSGGEVEMERCTQCGGFWGEKGRIQDSFGSQARYELVGGETTRYCVLCRILMTPAKLPSGISVEVCSACRGMYLDAGELARLGAREPGRSPERASAPKPVKARPAAAPPPLPTPGTFECIECGKRKPLREGQALRDGLACRACMRARAEGQESEEGSLRNLLLGKPRS